VCRKILARHIEHGVKVLLGVATSALSKVTMTSLLKSLNKPEYLRQPVATFRRFFRRSQNETGIQVVRLPWGLPLEVDTSEAIGRTISHHGLFEIAVAEAIFRLTDASDIFLDVGANVGFMSSAAVAAGSKKILSFEPHPELFRRLETNLLRWTNEQPQIAGRASAQQKAVSSQLGTAKLRYPKLGFSGNNGVSSLESRDDQDDYGEVEVLTTTLTEILALCGERVGVLKIDIEGHELKAFKSCEASFREGGVRDILFEDHDGFNSEVSQFLSSFGYTIFGLNKTLWGPVLLDNEAAVARFVARSDESLNFLATLDPARARKRMSGRGYKCLANVF
jgi:FkbM family methyltransferase